MDKDLKGVFIGVDIGKKVDYTVLSIIEKWQNYRTDMFKGRMEDGKPYYHLTETKRFPLDVKHNIQVAAIEESYKRIKAYYNKDLQMGQPEYKPYLIIDLGNVGESYFDDYTAAGLNVYGVKAHSGEKNRYEDKRWYVNIESLYNAVEILLDHKRLIFADDIPDRKGLIKEMVQFRWKHTPKGNLTAENLRDSDHDDRVDSIAVALWFAQHGIREFGTFPKSKLGL